MSGEFHRSLRLRQSKPARVAKSGEERFLKGCLPLRQDLQDLLSCFEPALLLVATCLEGIDVASDAMARRIRIMLEEHLPRLIQRPRETA